MKFFFQLKDQLLRKKDYHDPQSCSKLKSKRDLLGKFSLMTDTPMVKTFDPDLNFTSF